MKEISTHFCAIEPAQISRALLMKEEISMPANSRDFPCKGKVLFEQSPTDTEAGTKWNMTFRAVTTDKFAERLNGRRQCIGFFLSDGSLRIIGAHDAAPVLHVTPYDGSVCVVSATFESTTPLAL